MEDICSLEKFENLTLERRGCVFIITMMMGSENRLNIKFCQEMIQAFNTIRGILGADSDGAVITRGKGAKFFCTVQTPLFTHLDNEANNSISRGSI